MAEHVARNEVARQRLCHWKECGAFFLICVHCDRGQRYCSDSCREAARRQLRAKANARYQSSTSGKEAHRDCQRRYRSRRQAAPVTDEGMISVTETTIPPPVAARPPARLPFCVECGKPRFWIDLRAGIPGEWQRQKYRNSRKPVWGC